MMCESTSQERLSLIWPTNSGKALTIGYCAQGRVARQQEDVWSGLPCMFMAQVTGAITGSPFSCSYFTLGKVSKVNFGVLLDQDFLQVDVPHVAQSTASNHWVRKSTHKRNITVNSIQYDQYHKALCTKPTQTGPASVTKVAKCGKCMLKQKNENNLLKVTHVHAWQLVSIGLLEV